MNVQVGTEVKICTDYKNWVEEEVIEPVQRKKKGEWEKCKRKKCRKRCICCNKWKCWIATFFYWIIEWLVRIVGKWMIYILCRAISAILTLGWTILVGLKWLWCNVPREKGTREGHFQHENTPTPDPLTPLELRPLKRLRVDIVIIDKDETTRNPIDPAEIDNLITQADNILKASAKIEVKRKGKVRRDRSVSLYLLDSSSFSAKVGEWLKATLLLIGRESIRNLTVYIVGNIQEAHGLHQPLYGSVFMNSSSPDTTLAHELAHALLSVTNAGHVNDKGNLMFVPWNQRERDAGWPGQPPTLTMGQWCSMRQSRWLDWSWSCERCPK